MSDENAIEQSMATLQNSMDRLAAAVDKTRRAQDVSEKMQDFKKGGRFFYAPATEKEAVHRAILDEQRVAMVDAHTVLHAAVAEQEAVLAAVVRDVMESPEPATAFLDAHGRGGIYSLELKVQLDVLHELRLSRCAADLKSAPPSVVEAAYQRALKTQDHTTIGWIESQHGLGWKGITDHPENQRIAESEASQRLGRHIDAVRQGRVTSQPQLVSWRKKLDEAKTRLTRGQDLHGLGTPTPRPDMAATS